MESDHNPVAHACTGCGSADLGAEFLLGAEPVVLNYRFAGRRAAMDLPRRDMVLRECGSCGLIFNAALDPDAIPYDEDYENRQNFSPAFTRHLESIADGLIEHFPLCGKGVLEIGCGKGDFLRLLCDRAGAKGFGYDTSYEATSDSGADGVEFFKSYLTAKDYPGHPVDLIVCRHVIEHVPDIGEFLVELLAIARAAGGVPTYLETPSWEWISDNGAFWDVFYEHCNYFPNDTLKRLCELAGFKVLRQTLVFGGQYQSLEIVPADSDAGEPTPPPVASLDPFAGRFAANQADLRSRLADGAADRGWAIWGAGAKGVALSNRLTDPPPLFVIDSNPAKQGGFIPGSGIEIISPEDGRVAEAALILIANSNYTSEIRAVLSGRRLEPKLIPL